MLNRARENSHYFADLQFMYYMLEDQTFLALPVKLNFCGTALQ